MNLSELPSRLFEFVSAKPVISTTAGAGAGLGGWLVSKIEVATKLLQLGACGFGFISAFFVVLLATPKVIRFVRAWRARGLIAADQE